MKASRDQLKSLMKEILIEILGEGLGNVQPLRPVSGRSQIVGTTVEQRTTNNRRRTQFDPRLDAPVGNRQPSDALKEAVKRESGGNPIMADILADTAMTTLPTQLSHGDNMGQPSPGMSGHMPGQKEQFHGEVADVFGDSAELRADGSSHWADLAFGGGVKKSA